MGKLGSWIHCFGAWSTGAVPTLDVWAEAEGTESICSGRWLSIGRRSVGELVAKGGCNLVKDGIGKSWWFGAQAWRFGGMEVVENVARLDVL